MPIPPRRSLPPLNALRAFEAFGRQGRMTKAAEELFVTHGAVSRQIRQLEQWMGFALTEGPKTQLRLTPRARRLHGAVSAAFDLIAEAASRAPTADRDLHLACYGTLAIRWLIPRMADFAEKHPDIRLQLQEITGEIDFDAAAGVDAAMSIACGPSRACIPVPGLRPGAIGSGRGASRFRRRPASAASTTSPTLWRPPPPAWAWPWRPGCSWPMTFRPGDWRPPWASSACRAVWRWSARRVGPTNRWIALPLGWWIRAPARRRRVRPGLSPAVGLCDPLGSGRTAPSGSEPPRADRPAPPRPVRPPGCG